MTIDLKKAFDTVDHCILLEKLEMCGFDQPTLKWFKSYLEGRRQFTSINGYKSDEREITCGVPQGSLLGPLLFTLFVNDMPNNVHFCGLSGKSAARCAARDTARDSARDTARDSARDTARDTAR